MRYLIVVITLAVLMDSTQVFSQSAPCSPDDQFPYPFCPGPVVHCSKHPLCDPDNPFPARTHLPDCVILDDVLSGDETMQPTVDAPGLEPPNDCGDEPVNSCGDAPQNPCGDPPVWTCGKEPTTSDPNYVADHATWQACSDAYWAAVTVYQNCWDPYEAAVEAWLNCNKAFQTSFNNWSDCEQAWGVKDGAWWDAQDHAASTAIEVFNQTDATIDANNALQQWLMTLGGCPEVHPDPSCCIHVVFDRAIQEFEDPVKEAAYTEAITCGEVSCSPRKIHVNMSSAHKFGNYGQGSGNWVANPGYVDPISGNTRDYATLMYYTGMVPPSGQNGDYHTMSLFQVLEHEIGHWLGLKHPNQYACSTQGGSRMNSSGTTRDVEPQLLSQMDKCMFQKLYCDPNCPDRSLGTKSPSLPLEIGDQAMIVQPNPTSAVCQLRYIVNSPTLVSVSLCDVLGREIIQVFNGKQESGDHIIELPTEYLAAGTYTCRLVRGNVEKTVKLTVVR